MTAWYGYRKPNGLTAADPGDTIVFPFASYNDSGDSEAFSGLAVTDIELFKDGQPTARATDSGYSLISDTGQVANRVGLGRVSVQLFNTSDDTGFFHTGSMYQAAIDAVTIDGKTVRMWLGSFDIGPQEVNTVEIAGDTGMAIHVGQMGDENDTGTIGAPTATGFSTHDAAAVRAALDTGTLNSVTPGASAAAVRAAMDTGTLDSSKHANDTGTVDANVISVAANTYDTGPFTGNASVDTGILVTAAAPTTAQIRAAMDTGTLNSVSAVGLDTGQVNQAVWQADARRGITEISDTGLYDRLDTLETYGNSNLTNTNDLQANQGNWLTATGFSTHNAAAVRAAMDTGTLNSVTPGASAAAVRAAMDTGTLDSSIHANDTGTVDANVLSIRGDTGMAQHVGQMGDEYDTGRLPAEATTTLDTGATKDAVWGTAPGTSTRYLTGSENIDTGIAQRTRVAMDTGTLNAIDTGVPGNVDALSTSVTNLSTKVDTGVPASVRVALDTGTLNAIDTGVPANVDAISTAVTNLSTKVDTGVPASVRAAVDTGTIDVNIKQVNSVTIQGIGDTGTANTWRPV